MIGGLDGSGLYLRSAIKPRNEPRTHMRGRALTTTAGWRRLRLAVRDAILDVCKFSSWTLYALHVRITHVHGVVEADSAPSQMIRAWKAYATRALRSTARIAMRG